MPRAGARERQLRQALAERLRPALARQNTRAVRAVFQTAIRAQPALAVDQQQARLGSVALALRVRPELMAAAVVAAPAAMEQRPEPLVPVLVDRLSRVLHLLPAA